MTHLLLLSAITLSGVAEYYSIMGLVAIFAAAPISITVMGVALGISKLVVTSWLYRNWKQTPVLVRSYFVTAILVLMLLTSMGIFGYLSKAHSDQNLVSGTALSQLALIEEQLKTEKEIIDANRKIIAQLDTQVNETISRTSAGTSNSSTASNGDAGISRSIAIRRSQAGERKASQEAILSAQAKINKLNTDKAPIAAEVRKVEAEVGPIKYIAQLIYGQEATSQDTLEAAVRWVIILIVLVFDPLAVLMFIAYNQTVSREKDTIAPIDTSEKDTTPDTLKTDQFGLPEIPEDRIPPVPKVRKQRVKKVPEREEDRVLIPTDDKD